MWRFVAVAVVSGVCVAVCGRTLGGTVLMLFGPPNLRTVYKKRLRTHPRPSHSLYGAQNWGPWAGPQIENYGAHVAVCGGFVAVWWRFAWRFVAVCGGLWVSEASKQCSFGSNSEAKGPRRPRSVPGVLFPGRSGRPKELETFVASAFRLMQELETFPAAAFRLMQEPDAGA